MKYLMKYCLKKPTFSINFCLIVQQAHVLSKQIALPTIRAHLQTKSTITFL